MNMPLPDIRPTSDGSPTLFSPLYQAAFHSVHGALRESLHVFIDSGLHHVLRAKPTGPVRVFEMGLGTGLNAWLTTLAAEKWHRELSYTAMEKHPLPTGLAESLDYPGIFRPEARHSFLAIHEAPWNEWARTGDTFLLYKQEADLMDTDPPDDLDLVYYDAFGPETQPELWSENLLGRICACLRPGGVLVTYCAKGQVRRNLQAHGMLVERLPGPPGKREMLRASRPGGLSRVAGFPVDGSSTHR
jgi:tRNA U34 5-methylaminomethyl-2-thiouridine-forming methyltransferase MnmC